MVGGEEAGPVEEIYSRDINFKTCIVDASVCMYGYGLETQKPVVQRQKGNRGGSGLGMLLLVVMLGRLLSRPEVQRKKENQ